MSVRDIAQLGLARLSGGQKVASSNLAIPTIFILNSFVLITFFFPPPLFSLELDHKLDHKQEEMCLWR